MRKQVFIRALWSVVSVGLAASVHAERIYGLTSGGSLVHFDSATPGNVTNVGVISGATAGTNFQDIDFRPVNGTLYGVATNPVGAVSARVYRIDRTTAVATPIGGAFGIAATAGGQLAIDFDPASDALRIVTRVGSNYRVSPTTGAVLGNDAVLSYAGGSVVPEVVAIGYDNNVPLTASRTLYGYTWNSDEFVHIGSLTGSPDSANTGKTTIVGGSGQFPSTSNVGFDVSPSGVAYASMNVGSPLHQLYAINLSSGAATPVGNIGGNPTLVGLAIVPEPTTVTVSTLAIAALALRRRRQVLK